MAVGAKRVDIGFQGGQVLALRVMEEDYDDLRRALDDDRAGRWHELKAVDSHVAIDLSQVVYVRIDAEEHKVGF